MRRLTWAGVLLGTALLFFLGLVGVMDGWGSSAFPHHIHRLRPPAFRVGILGDSQKGLANLRNITSEVVTQGADFLIHTGDLVSTNDDGHYRLAAIALRKGGADSMPFVAPGNHDVKGGTERFRAWCGDLEKSFTLNEVAFVLLDNAHGKPPEPAHVEARIAEANPHKAVVLAMHQPPFDKEGKPRPEYAAFLTWLEKSKVAYLFCGHVHAYIKKKVGETTVIINGVGGDYDSWQLHQKVYATMLDIDGTKIVDRTIEIEPSHEVWENVEHFAIGHVAEAYRRHTVSTWLGTLLLAGGVGWGWVRLLRRRNIPSTP